MNFDLKTTSNIRPNHFLLNHIFPNPTTEILAITSNIPTSSLHRRAEGIAKKYFEGLILEDQDLLGTPDQWAKVLALIPEQSLRESLEKVMSQCSNSHQRWNTIQSEISKAINKVGLGLVLE